MMTQALQQLTPRQAYGLVLAQFAVTVLLSLLLLFVFGGEPDETGFRTALSGLVGGMIATLANAWFAVKVFNLGKMDDPARVLRSFYWGEINKILLTGALFITAFVMIEDVNGAALIGTYFVVHMTPFVVSMFIKDTP